MPTLPDLSLLRTFGCRVYVLPPQVTRHSKLCSDAHTGLFLGYSQTMKNILYYDSATHHVKSALHVVFDEAMADSDAPSPNARLLHGQAVLPTDVIHATSGLPQMAVTSTPFTAFVTIDILYDPTDALPFGFTVSACPHLRCAYISDFLRPPCNYTLLKARRTLLGAYVVSVSDHLVFSISDLARIPSLLLSEHGSSPPFLVSVILAPERRSSFDDRSSSFQLRLHDLRWVSALQSVTGEGTTAEFNQTLSSFLDLLSPDHMDFVIYRLQSSTMTDEERALPKLTR